MKKSTVFFVLLAALFCWLQCGRRAQIESSIRTDYPGGYVESVTVVANRIFILDPEKFAEETLERYISDSSGSAILRGREAADLAGLYMSAYTNRIALHCGRLAFQAHFVREGDRWILEHISGPRIG